MTTKNPPIPLTTVFTPPNNCSLHSLSTWDILAAQIGLSNTFHQAQYFVAPSLPADCVPSGYDTSRPAVTPRFSPGVCPNGYTVAASNVNSDQQYTSWCCPSGMSLSYTIAGSTLCTAEWVRTGYTISTEGGVGGGTSYFLLNQGTQTATMLAQFTPIVVTWASSDIPTFTPTSAPILAAQAAASASAASETLGGLATSTGRTPAALGGGGGARTGPSASASSVSSARLSTGAKAGIGVGVAVGALMIISVLIWFLFRRRKRVKDSSAQESYDKAELHGEAVESKKPDVESSELGEDGNVHEMLGKGKLAEADRGAERHELPSGFEGYEVRSDILDSLDRKV